MATQNYKLVVEVGINYTVLKSLFASSLLSKISYAAPSALDTLFTVCAAKATGLSTQGDALLSHVEQPDNEDSEITSTKHIFPAGEQKECQTITASGTKYPIMMMR